jgi:hypothetical protein
MRRLATFARATAAACVLLAGVATADPAPNETIRLSWVRDDTAAACPDARVVADRVRARIGRDPFSDVATTAAEVSVERAGDAFVAHVRIRGADGAMRGERTIRSEESCDTAASAVALALALFVDPDAALRPPPATSLSPSPPSSPTPTPTPTPATAPATATPTATATSDSVPTRPVPFIRAGSGALGAFTAPGLLPGAGWGARVTADFNLLPRLHLLATGLFLPEEPTTGGGFAFGISAFGAGGCFDLVESASFQLAPCASLLAGEIHAVVYSLQPLPPGGRIWGAGQGAARARLQVFSSLFLEADIGLFVPLVRYAFSVVGQNTPVFQETVVVPTAELAMGLSFP